MAGLLGEEAEGKTQDGVQAEFADEDHDRGGGGFGDSVREPAMQRKDRDLDGEGDEESERTEPKGVVVTGDGVLRCKCLEGGEVEGAGFDVEPDHADEEDGRGDEGVDEVLDGGAAAVFRAAEGGDQDGHGNKREFPEAVVEEEVQRDEDADHRDLLEEEEDEEGFGAGFDGVPGGENPERGEETGKNNQPHREAVYTEVVTDGGVGDPGEILLELEAGRAVHEAGWEMQREQEGEERENEGDPVVLPAAFALREESEHSRSHKRGEEDLGQYEAVEVHLIPLSL